MALKLKFEDRTYKVFKQNAEYYKDAKAIKKWK